MRFQKLTLLEVDVVPEPERLLEGFAAAIVEGGSFPIVYVSLKPIGGVRDTQAR